MSLVSVSSSDLRAVGYDPWSATLVVQFHSGGAYAYDQVPHFEYSALMNAPSHGQYFPARIRNRYQCRRIS